jgi:hypothetical protein
MTIELSILTTGRCDYIHEKEAGCRLSSFLLHVHIPGRVTVTVTAKTPGGWFKGKQKTESSNPTCTRMTKTSGCV